MGKAVNRRVASLLAAAAMAMILICVVALGVASVA